MKKFYRVLAYIKPFLGYAGLNVLFNLLTIVFSLFSFALLIPFLNLLFGIEELVTDKPNLELSTSSFLDYLNYQISAIIVAQGKIQALVYICLVIMVAFFLRNFARFFAMYFMANVRIGSIRGIRNDIYKKILILPLSFYSKHKKGDIIARITTDVRLPGIHDQHESHPDFVCFNHPSNHRFDHWSNRKKPAKKIEDWPIKVCRTFGYH